MQDNFSCVAVGTVCRLPLTGFKLTLDVQLRALLDVLFDDADKTLVLHNDVVPFGLGFLFAAGLVTVFAIPFLVSFLRRATREGMFVSS